MRFTSFNWLMVFKNRPLLNMKLHVVSTSVLYSLWHIGHHALFLSRFALFIRGSSKIAILQGYSKFHISQFALEGFEGVITL